MNPNLYRDVKSCYLKGYSQEYTMRRYGIKQYQYAKIISRVVAYFEPEQTEDRIMQATLMERNIFKLIKQKRDVSGLINQFSSFCA